MPRWFKLIVGAGAAVIVVAVATTFWPRPVPPPGGWGATFNVAYAQYLGIDWQASFTAANGELGIRQWRLSAPWDELEPQPGQYDFTTVDWLMQEAARYQSKVILTIGRRTPRWPECHDPAWVGALSRRDQNEQILALMATLVQRYRASPALAAWQVENEMSLDIFGECPPSDRDFFAQEVALVHSLDAGHPVYTTVSGELSRWGSIARLVDGIGTSLYRITYNKIGGYFHYPYPALYYRWHAQLTTARTGTPVYISELQMEPWARMAITRLPIAEQLGVMDLAEAQRTLRIAEQTGLSPIYLWGVEWWYWLKERQGHPEWWQFMRDYLGEYTDRIQ